MADEVDSLLTERSEGENEASRRIKTEFLVQFDGISSSSSARILIMGATNRPQELDEAARRRFTKRIYIPLPDEASRLALLENLLKKQKHSLTKANLRELTEATEGFSGSDMTVLAKDAALGPIRELGMRLREAPLDSIRPLAMQDFKEALKRMRPSVSPASIAAYQTWNAQFGSFQIVS